MGTAATLKRVGLQSIAGVVGGVVGVTIALRASSQDPRPASPPVVAVNASQTAAPQPGGPPVNVSFGGWDEERIKALEAKAKQAAPEPVGAAGVAPPVASAAAAAFQQHLADLVLEHDRQPRDPGWAQSTESGLSKDLAGLANEAQFQNSKVDCRTNSCLITAAWPTYADAAKASRLMLHAKYSANCTRTVLMEPPEDESKPYEGRVLLDCQALRDGS